ncbi:hypothetical protein MPTK1_3g22730 [Marchantia polymorpha subsp. ruderalis]|uniref:PhoD-like phosphatase metallophosphatase domain-containing protein n=2 Tax=Marchantia polymorpha TaxID=3197 RepID=A0AAF6B3P9_MARPO|nr:hypothetical protein MARPO_0024s0050 [Marchantia polymorpha]BBN06633.1 hypothetical protein Mp_3g22730 [Marchantia polymorpha subsp. ruderalis]|eukprot:PTQ43532.1 hypothetical protein MARPO_0024s0050 [Marchantia polymorpha]
MGDPSEGGTRHGKGRDSPRWSMRDVKKHAQQKFVSTVDRLTSFHRGSGSSNIKDILKHSGQVNVSVGPVIGKVTDCTARILLEVGEPGEISMQLEEESVQNGVPNGQPAAKSKHKKKSGLIVKKSLVAMRPAIFVFENLNPETRYHVRLKGCYPTVPSSFCTFPRIAPPSLNFAIISCNKIFITEKEIPVHSDLWAHLEKMIRLNKVNMCLHLGDQIYGDGDKLLDAEAGEEPGDWSDCFKKSNSLLADFTKDQWEEHYETVCEFYREVYRRTWRHLPTAYCLANCPNLMIYDDHEVRDNWADLAEDWNKESSDFFIAVCAWRVNLEYQRQLHEDVNFDKLEAIDRDYHFHLIAGVAIMFIDIRGSRTFFRCEDQESSQHRYLGAQQWKDISGVMGTGGLFEQANVLLVCTPAPLVFLDHNFTDVASNVPRLVDFKGHWSANLHYEEQKRMIDILFAWKGASTKRDILVLGGDVHCGGHSEIIYDRQESIRQLTTSAIANHPLPKSAYYLLRAAGNLAAATGRKFAFRHHDWTRSRNYGLVQIKNQPDDSRPEVTSQLIKGKFMIGIKEGKKVSNFDKTKMLGCESWLCPTGRSYR